MKVRIWLAVLLASLSAIGSVVPAHAFDNGRAKQSELTSIYIPGNRAFLAKGAGAAWNTMRLCAVGNGVDLYPGASAANPARTAYRTYAAQVYLWNLYLQHRGSLAARPGTSNHGRGNAIDLGLVRMRTWVNGNGATFKWRKIEAPSEWWHVNYTGGFSRPNPGTSQRYPVLRKGSGGPCQAPAVRELQRRLGLKQDGELGPQTAKAVRVFQQKHHQKKDGIVGVKTWTLLRKQRGVQHPNVIQPVPGAPAPVVGVDVKAAQGLLNARFTEEGHREWRVKVTGVLDRSTVIAVKRFQRSRKLKKTGKIDEKTWAALRKPRVPTQVNSVFGPDVSSFQGDIDWKKVKKSGASFAFVKATEGVTFTDPRFGAGRWKAMRDAGLLRGAYHFARPQPGRSASSEAKHYLAVVKRAGGFRAGDLPPVLDIEVSKLSAAKSGKWARDWCSYVDKQTKKGCIVYTGGYWKGIRQPAPPSSWLWLAEYNATAHVAFGWKDWTFWQFTDKARVNWHSRGVDMSRFKGDLARLKRVAK